MASRHTNQFIQNFNTQPTLIEGSFRVGSTGQVAPSSGILGRGVTSVTTGGTGQYAIQLNDPYYRLLNFSAMAISPTSAAGITSDGALVTGKPYSIVFPSTSTNWTLLGVPRGITPAYGVPFVASSGASAGAVTGTAGTVIQILPSNVAGFEVLPNPNMCLAPTLPAVPAGASSAQAQPLGAIVNFQTLNTSNAVVAPTSGTVIRFQILMRNSTLLGTNENSGNY